MNRLFVKIEDGEVVGNPIAESNLKYIFGGEIPLDIELHGYREHEEKESKKLSIHDAKDEKKRDLKELFVAATVRPRVDTGLGFEVDGGSKDLTNFEVVRDLKIKQIKLSDNSIRELKDGDAEKIVNAIKMAGVKRYAEKWEWEKKIDAAKSIDELEKIDISGAFGTETI